MSSLIGKRVVNVYIMMALFPAMIPELSTFFKVLASEVRNASSSKKEGEKKRMSSVCTMLITIICEYYQFLKNRKPFVTYTAERFILILLENIFCMIKKDFYKEIFLNPFEHLEKLQIPDADGSNSKL